MSEKNPTLRPDPGALPSDPGLPERPAPISTPEVPPGGPPAKPQTVFIHKLYDMLEDSSISHLIWWLQNNDLFCLLPGEEFSKVLSQYFKHTNIASFIRQLNMYGFHKVNDSFQSDDAPSNSVLKWEFRHSTSQFRKGDLELLKLIKRRLLKNVNLHKEIVNLKSIPPTSNPVDLELEQPPQPFLHQQDLAHALEMLSPLHPYPYQPYEGQMARPQLANAPSFENSLNVKIVELTGLYKHLQADHQNLQSQHDIVVTELKRTQADLVRILDLLEVHTQPAPAAPVHPLPQRLGPEDIVDRNRNKTPVTVSTEDTGASPMTRVQHNVAADVAALRAQIASRAAAFLHALQALYAAPLLQSAQPSSQNLYHLSDTPVLAHLRADSSHQIVPQHYPLNPNYTVYPPNEIAFRQFKMNNDDTPARHLLILMDPLQPVPSTQKPVDQHLQPHAENRSYSPLSMQQRKTSLSTNLQQNAGPPHPAYMGPHYLYHNPYFGGHPQPPPPPPHTYRVASKTELRTNLLPILDPPHAPGPAIKQEQLQRHLLTSIQAEYPVPPRSLDVHRNSSLTSLSINFAPLTASYGLLPPPGIPSSSNPGAPTTPTEMKPQAGRPRTLLKASGAYGSLDSGSNSAAKASGGSEEKKKQLPSMSELDRSIKNIAGSPVYSLLNARRESRAQEASEGLHIKQEDQTKLKKRRL